MIVVPFVAITVPLAMAVCYVLMSSIWPEKDIGRFIFHVIMATVVSLATLFGLYLSGLTSNGAGYFNEGPAFAGEPPLGPPPPPPFGRPPQ